MEEFRDILGYEWLYVINLKGIVKSYYNNRYVNNNIQKTIKHYLDTKWYPRVKLCNKGVQKEIWIHRLVAQAYLWLDINDRKILVCHKDDNPKNNHKDNLFLWTYQENTQDMILKWRGLGVKISQFNKKLEFIKEWASMSQASRILNIPVSSISYCCKGNRNLAWGFVWRKS